ncbi:MAG: hypothetical protein E5X61_43225, partial [Mesorhizobium sp.]
LSIGILAQTFLIGLVWWKNGDPRYLVVAIAMVLVGIFRMRNFQKYNNLPSPTTWEEAHKRENDYILYGSMHGLT